MNKYQDKIIFLSFVMLPRIQVGGFVSKVHVKESARHSVTYGEVML